MYAITLITFLFFTGLVGLITWFMTRKDDHGTSAGYFLAGRTLTAGFIAGSLMLTNLSTEQLVGLNGAAFTHGLSVMVWEVVAAVGLVIMALFFLPKYLRSGIATIPEFLEKRFDHTTRSITTLIFIVAYAFILLPIILYTGATGLTNILNISEITGIEDYSTNIWITVWLIGIIGSIYAIFGGLRTVAVSDTINGFGLLVGGVMITVFGLYFIGDGEGLIAGYQAMISAHPEKFNSIGGAGSQVPFFTIFTGVMVLNIFYWCTNQQIIQRTFGASSLAEGQKGVLLAGGFKIIGPLILVVPGLIAFYMFKQGMLPEDMKTDMAYGLLVQTVMPKWLTGFFAAVLLGAILSSFNSALNSTCTLFSLGFYKGIIRKDATDEEIVKSGKKFGWGIAVFSMCLAPMLLGQDSIFSYLQAMNAIYFVPILAVVVVGLLTKRVPAKAANIGMIFAFVVIIAVYFIPGLNDIINADSPRFLFHNFHFITIVLVAAIGLILLLGKLNPLEKPWVHKYSGDVDMTPWKYSKHAGVGLLAVVFSIYAYFADFSVIKGMGYMEIVYAAVFSLLIIFALTRFKNRNDSTQDDEDIREK
jgi:SSS family solute:Na+ symporter